MTKSKGFSPFEKVMNSRKELVETILESLERDGTLLPPTWNKSAMRPQNPVSEVYYRGGNRLKLMNAAIKNNYKDPRWCTYMQAKAKGWQVKKGAKGILCEKWILMEEIEETDSDGKVIFNEDGKPKKKLVMLDRPLVNYFTVFNGESINGIPELKLPSLSHNETLKLAESFIRSSKCPINEVAQDSAFYDPVNDHIVLPLKESFLTTEDFLRTTLHEMSHSTGHPDRLNRPMMNMFGTPDYAREELNAEIGSIFTKCDLGIDFEDNGYIEERHQQYIKSWISLLKNDPNEFFRACANADKISEYLIQNYEQFKELQQVEETAYTIELKKQFANNHFTCNDHLLNGIHKLNKLTNHQHTLKDIHNKFQKLDTLSTEEQMIIKTIGSELQNQEVLFKHTSSQTLILPEA